MASYFPVHYLCSDYQGCCLRVLRKLLITALKTECGANFGYSAEHPQDGAAAWLEQSTLWCFQIGAAI